MNLQLVNGLALVTALGLAMWGATRQPDTTKAEANVVVAPAPGPDATELTDARGRVVPVADYARIVSLNSVADAILLQLVAPDRLLGVTGYSLAPHPEGYRYGDRPGVASSSDLEAILALKPDLVVASRFAEEPLMARLREEGIAVFDPGDLRGVETTLHTIDLLGTLLGQAARAERVAADYRLRLSALHHAVTDAERVPGIWLTIYGDNIYGGSVGTSYGDMLHYGGVHDMAADAGYRDWPQYSLEQLLTLDPPLVVTQPGMGAAICGHSALHALACCGARGRVIEVPGKYHSDAGLGVVHAARGLLALVHPDRLPEVRP